MDMRVARWLMLTTFMLVVSVACSPAATPPSPTPPGKPPIDYATLEAEIDKAISSGSGTLDNVRAVLVNVDGETKIAHYRHGSTKDDHGHMFSVTKSVVSILIGMAIADGLIVNLDEPLVELLPKHRQAMSGDTPKVTLRQVMTMSGGFDNDFFAADLWEESAEPGGDFVELLLERPKNPPGTGFWYSDPSAHVVAAVLAAALERADEDRPRTVLDYARDKLFDPLGISTRPTYSRPLPDVFAPEFVTAGFGWGTDPNGIQLGGLGLRLTPPDMMKIGELYRSGGVWDGKQIVDPNWIQESTSPSTDNGEYGLLWWILTEPEGAGYGACGHHCGQRILVLPRSRAVIVYMSDVQPDSQMDDDDLDPLDDVLVSPFL
jgi:CubicO group peptidase (beta-lactamase class C family)